MAVCILLRDSRDLHLLPMAASFAAAERTKLSLLQVDRSKKPNETRVVEPLLQQPSEDRIERAIRVWIDTHFESLESASPPLEVDHGEELPQPSSSSESAPQSSLPAGGITYQRISTDEPVDSLLVETKKLGVKLLIVPQPEPADKRFAETLEWHLLRRMPCETFVVRWRDRAPAVVQEILVAAENGANSLAALSRAANVARANGGQVTALYVEPAVDEVAPLVGERILKRITERALGRGPENVRYRVEIANSFHQGLRQALDDAPNLVLMGATERREIRRLMTEPLLDAEMPGNHFLAVGIVRAAMPLTSRVGQFVNNLLCTYVPQMSRENRVSLVERVQSSSEWNFDFTALMILSTLIASLGLLLDSGAVIIGAMLVAPLMTPIVGSGLAIVQGNALLFRRALKSVGQGFALAFLVAFIVGLLTSWIAGTEHLPTPEMLSRDSPDVLDLLVAFISGLVAAYAMGRPGLTSALPGVAIAAALIPPIATAGMSSSWGDFTLGGGALLLFFTNIIAIALATAISLRSVGIRDTHPHGTKQRWSRVAAVVLIVIAFALLVFESWPDPPIPDDLKQKVATIIEEDGGRIRSLSWQEEGSDNVLLIEAQHSTSETGDLVDRLATAVNSFYEKEVELELKLQIVQRPISP